MLLRATQRALRSGARRKSTVVMMRHGESTWNLENKFTGSDRGAEGRRPSPSSPETRGLHAVEHWLSRRWREPSASTPSSRSISNRSRAQAGTTAPCPRRATRRRRRLEDSWLPKASSSTSPSLLL